MGFKLRLQRRREERGKCERKLANENERNSVSRQGKEQTKEETSHYFLIKER